MVHVVETGGEWIEPIGEGKRRRLVLLGLPGAAGWLHEDMRRCGICGVQGWTPHGFDTDGWKRSVRVCEWHTDYCPEHASMGEEFDLTLRATLENDAADMLAQLARRVAGPGRL